MKDEVFIMRIALINENSQAAKNEMIYANLKKVAESKGHTVDNYGMYSAEDAAQLTYVQNGILAAILLNSGTFSRSYLKENQVAVILRKELFQNREIRKFLTR